MIRLALLLLLVSLLAPTAAFADDPAQPRIELHWNTCGNQAVEPYAPTDHALLVILTGAEGDYDGIEVTIGVDGRCNPSSGGWDIPDAWRFDNAGCQAGLLRITRPASDNGCPGLVASQTLDAVTLGTQHEYYGGPGNVEADLPAILIRITSIFPLRHLTATSKYVVAKITIPMQETVANIDPNGVLCGCGSTPLKIEPIQTMLSPIPGQYVGGYRTAWVQDNYCMIAPQPTPGLNAQPCYVVPASSQSWGAVKAFYR